MIDFIYLAGGFIISILLAVMIIPNILFVSHKRRLFDMPDSRKVHQRPVSRLGGVSFFPAISVSFCLIIGTQLALSYYADTSMPHSIPYSFIFLGAGCMMLYLIGIMDDIVGVGYRYKFIVQFIAAAILAFSGSWINTLGGLFGIWSIPAWIGIPFTIFVIIYITNAINLIDGIDGLASGLSIIAMIVFSLTFIFQHEYIYALLAFATLGVLLPFWFYNVFGYTRHHHKLFMGDTGSLTLGYILSFIVIKFCTVSPATTEHDDFGVIIAISALFIPLLDVVRVVINRIARGKSPFLPDRSHIHHKLLDTGMRPRLTMLTILGMSVLFIILNVLLSKHINITILLILDVVLWLIFIFTIDHFIQRHKKESVQTEKSTS